jgi:serine/threonine-protein kinase RsbW
METKRFPGVVDSLEGIRDYADELAVKAGLSKKATYNLKIALDEIATNIILYGYERAGIQADVLMLSDITADHLTVILEDEAAQFDPLSREMPDAEDLAMALEDRDIGGLGIFLTVNGVDDFSYEYIDGKNRNKFIMNVVKS